MVRKRGRLVSGRDRHAPIGRVHKARHVTAVHLLAPVSCPFTKPAAMR